MCQDSSNKKKLVILRSETTKDPLTRRRSVILSVCEESPPLKSSCLKHGYSLIEIMMAILFFGVIAVSLSAPMTNSMYLTTNNKTVNNANNLAKTYLKDLEESWKIQADYDDGSLVSLSDYNEDGKYTIQVNSQTLETDDDSNVILRRITITYEDNNDNILCDLYYDYNRPGSV